MQVVSIKCGLLDDIYDSIGKEMLSEISKPLAKLQEGAVKSNLEMASTISSCGVEQRKGIL